MIKIDQDCHQLAGYPFFKAGHYAGPFVDCSSLCQLCFCFCFNFLISLLNICCGYPENQSQSDGSFEQPKDMLNVMGRKKDNFT